MNTFNKSKNTQIFEDINIKEDYLDDQGNFDRHEIIPKAKDFPMN